MKQNLFIIYWLTGEMDAVLADDISGGFGKLGYGGGALSAVDYYSMNTDPQHRDPDTLKWVGRAPGVTIALPSGLEAIADDLTASYLRAELMANIDHATSIMINRSDEDQILLQCKHAEYAGGHVACFTVNYGEYHSHAYNESTGDEPHYMARGTVHFHLTDPKSAIEAVIHYFQHGVDGRVLNGAVSIDEVIEKLQSGFRVMPVAGPTLAQRLETREQMFRKISLNCTTGLVGYSKRVTFHPEYVKEMKEVDDRARRRKMRGLFVHSHKRSRLRQHAAPQHLD